MSNSTNEINLSENLAKRIRKALGQFDNPNEPLQALVASLVTKINALQASAEVGNKVLEMQEKHSICNENT